MFVITQGYGGDASDLLLQGYGAGVVVGPIQITDLSQLRQKDYPIPKPKESEPRHWKHFGKTLLRRKKSSHTMTYTLGVIEPATIEARYEFEVEAEPEVVETVERETVVTVERPKLKPIHYRHFGVTTMRRKVSRSKVRPLYNDDDEVLAMLGVR